MPTTQAGALALIGWYQDGADRANLSMWVHENPDGLVDLHDEPIEERMPDVVLNTLYSFIEEQAA